MWVVLRPIPTKREGDAHGSLFERKILVKSPKPGNKAQRKVDYTNYYAITMSRNYYRKLWASILWRRKCGNYRDTGVSKNRQTYRSLFDLHLLKKRSSIITRELIMCTTIIYNLTKYFLLCLPQHSRALYLKIKLAIGSKYKSKNLKKVRILGFLLIVCDRLILWLLQFQNIKAENVRVQINWFKHSCIVKIVLFKSLRRNKENFTFKFIQTR